MYTTAVIYGAVLWIACVSAQAPSQCTDFEGLPNHQRRGLNIPVDPAIELCDFDLPAVWYRIDENLAQVPVEAGFCGTESPIWLNDDLPTTQYDNVLAKVCQNIGTSTCDVEFLINITNCGSFNVYFLTTTTCPSGYCINANTTGVANQTATFAPTSGVETTTAAVEATTAPDETTTAAVEATTAAVSSTTAIENCTATLLRPWVISLTDGGLCDLSVSSCVTPEATLHLNSPIEDTPALECRLRQVTVGENGPYETVQEVIVDAVFLDCNQVVCPIPGATIPTVGGPYITGWHVAVSNANQEFGVEKFFLPHDTTCMTCVFDADAVPSCTWATTHCFIDGKCIPDGMDNPDNPCETCDAMVTIWEYTPSAAGDVCVVDGVCYVNGTGPGSDSCLVCDIAQNATALSISDGNCYINNTCYNDGDPDPTDPCGTCDPVQDVAIFSQAMDTCLIDGQCYLEGEPDPNDNCQQCNPAYPSVFSEALIPLYRGSSVTCSVVCNQMSNHAQNGINLLCQLPAMVITQDLVIDTCYVADFNILTQLGCPGLDSVLTKLTTVCAHIDPFDGVAANTAACSL